MRQRLAAALAAREPAQRFERFTCFYGHCDNIVFPASTATLPGADNRHIAGHARMCTWPITTMCSARCCAGSDSAERRGERPFGAGRNDGAVGQPAGDAGPAAGASACGR